MDSDSSKSSTVEKMSSPLIDDGNYKLTSVTMKAYYKSSGNSAGYYSMQVNHDASVSPGYSGYGMSWQGNGVYRITVFGKSTLTGTGIQSETLDCSTNAISNVTLDSNGNVIDSLSIQSGCGGTSTTLTLVSDTYSVFSGGMTKYVVAEDSTYQYQITYTMLKQTSSSRESISANDVDNIKISNSNILENNFSNEIFHFTMSNLKLK